MAPKSKKPRKLINRRAALKGAAALAGALLIPRGVHGYAVPKRNPHSTWNMVMERHVVFDHTPDSPLKPFWHDIKKYGAPPTGALSDYFRRLKQDLPVGDLQLVGRSGSGKTLLAQCAKLILGRENVLGWNRSTLWYGRSAGRTNFACIDGYYKYGINDRPHGIAPILVIQPEGPEALHYYHNSVWLLDKITRPMPFDLLYGRLEEERDEYVATLISNAEEKSATKPKFRLVA